MIIGGNGLRITGSLRMGDVPSPPSYIFDNQFNYVTALFYGDGANTAQNNTFVDSSTNAFAITRTGSTTQGSFSPYGTSWSLYTNGTNSYAYLPYSATRAIGTGDFSIECWVYIVRQPANFTRIWSHQSNWGLAGNIGVELAFGTVDTLIQTLVDGNSQTYTSATYDTTGAAGAGHVRQWIHVVSSRQNGYLRLFVNGILREAQLSSTNINGTSNTSFGTNSQLGGDFTEMYISNFRMCIGAVPTSYSTTNTTGGTTIFTPPTSALTTTSQGASGVQLLLFQDNRIIDRSSNNFAVTTVNNPSIQRFSPLGNSQTIYDTTKIGGSAYFNGSGDYLQTPSSAVFNLNAGDWTIEGWFYLTVAPVANQRLFVIDGGSVYGIYTKADGGIYYGLFGSSEVTIAPAGTLSVFNQWKHIAFVKSGASTTICYVNGVSVGSTTSYSLPNSNSTFYIAGSTPFAANVYAGYISDVRVVKGTAVYTTTFVPPIIPLTTVTNTNLLLKFTNAGIFDSSGMTNAVTVSSAQVSTAQFKYGTASMKFNGTTDYCFLPAGHSFLFSKADFTIEAWVYISDNSSRKYILGPGTDTASHYKGFGFEIWGQQVCMWASSNGTTWDILESDTVGNRGSTLLAINTWHHVAATRSGSTFRSFVNGAVDKTFTSSATIFTDATIPYNIGRSGYLSGTFFFNGYIEELRVTRGYARYTSAFTPPTAQLPGA
jgi:hypothetical protein